MPILDEVSSGIVDAMRARNEVRLRSLRAMRAAFLNEMKKDGRKELPDEVCIGLLRRLEKQRRESIDAFENAGRAERAGAERAELGVLREFLPSLADEAQTRAWVQEAIDSSGASKPGDAGRVMGAVMKEHKGEVDGALAREIAGELLAD